MLNRLQHVRRTIHRMAELPKTMHAIQIQKQGGIEELQMREDVECKANANLELQWTC